MDLQLKQRAVIEFLAKEGCAPQEIHNRLKNVYKDTIVDISNVELLVKKFQDEKKKIADKPKTGQPSTSVSDENRQRADKLIRGNNLQCRSKNRRTKGREYLRRKHVMMENRSPLTSPDTRDTQTDLKAEEEGHVRIKEEAEEPDVGCDEPCKEEIPPEINTDGSSSRLTPVRCPHLNSQDFTDENDMFPLDDQDENLVYVKVKVKGEAEDSSVRSDDLYKEEVMPPEISPGEWYNPHVHPRYSPSFIFTVTETKDDNISADHPEQLCNTPNDQHIVCSGEENVPCPPSTECSGQELELISHQGTRTLNKSYSCLQCGRCFTQTSFLLSHQASHTGEKPYSCSECGKCFSWRHQLIRHRRSHKGQKPHSCSECGKCFMERPILIQHERTHASDRPYSCFECGKGFTDKSALVRHQKAHTGEKPYACSQCGQRFIYKSSMVIHERVHNGDNPYSCSQCGRGFKTKSNLVRHEKAHTGDRPYSCSDCGRGFISKSDLVIHGRVHTGDKPYPCSECGRRFSRKSSLVDHLVCHRRQEMLCGDLMVD